MIPAILMVLKQELQPTRRDILTHPVQNRYGNPLPVAQPVEQQVAR